MNDGEGGQSMVGWRRVWSKGYDMYINEEKINDKKTRPMVHFFTTFKGEHLPKSQVNRGAPLSSGRLLWKVV